MVVRLSVLCSGSPLPSGRFIVLIFVRGGVDPRVIVRLEGLGKLYKIYLTGTRTRDFPACSIFYYYFVCEAIGTAATPGLLCQPRVIVKMIVEKQMECRWQGKLKSSEKTCPSATFFHHKIPPDQTRVAAVGSRRLTA
jgi:hypothetical protein